ncbi:MAG: Mur ligase family protein [Thermoguttaceae bacterium]
MRLRSVSGEPISLRGLLPGAAFFGADDIAVDACWADPCRVEPGALFVALAKSGRDRRVSISEAMRRGCGAVLLQHRDPEISVPACFVPDVREAYGQVCHALAGNPSHRMKIIGVAGAGGRTTVSCLIASILNSVGQKIGVLGRLGCLDGREVCSSVRSIPPAEDLAEILARMVANGCSHAVLDVSGAALGKRRVEGVQFDAACVTGLRRNRNGKNDPLWNGRGTGPRLLDFLAPEGFVVINADDPGSVACLSEIDGPVLTVALRSAAEITARVVESGVGGQVFLLAAGSETMPVRTSMVGARHVRHCLMAAAVGLAYGIELVKIVQGLEAVDYVPGRLQRIDCGQPFGVFIDDARTPHTLAAALRALRPVTSGRLICVFSAGEGDTSLCSRMGRAAERFADLSAITGESRRTPISRTVLRDILSGFRRPAAVEIMPDRAGAIGWALGNAAEGDVVLLAGQRRPPQPGAGGKKRVLDDGEWARKWLYEHQRAEV